jgi:hypothetical protein
MVVMVPGPWSPFLSSMPRKKAEQLLHDLQD